MLKDWKWRTPITDILNLEENNVDLLRDTQIRNMHEMGEMKRGQELRVDEVSVHKLRENHETIQKLTSQTQEVHQHMNSMNDSGEN